MDYPEGYTADLAHMADYRFFWFEDESPISGDDLARIKAGLA